MYILINPINFTGLLACLTSKESSFLEWKLNFELQSMGFFTITNTEKTQNISCCMESLICFPQIYFRSGDSNR